jgi:5-methylcytosine-specific restriction endonuclease McrA
MAPRLAARSTTRRDKHRATIRRRRPPCYLCGEDIDYRAHYLEPDAFTLDHVIPLARGGPDTLDNIAPAHRKCNRDKSDRLLGQPATVTYLTTRNW